MRRTTSLMSAVFVLLVASFAAQAQTVTRGPYLQTGTPTSTVVRWRTNTATNSRVRYGTSVGSLTSFADDSAVTTEHVVTLSSLNPNTTYFYSVGTTAATLAGGDANHFFVTAPPAGTPKPTRVWILGDSGTADDNARAVRDAYFNFTGARHTDLWLMLGDNAYEDGTDSEYQTAVFDMYPTMLRKSVLWPTLGNHDGRSAVSQTQSGVYYNIFTLPRLGEAGGVSSGTEAYYSFTYGNIHFICLDSFDTDRSASGAMMSWLREDLANNTALWTIAFWHHPPYTKGSHDSDTETELIEMRQNALPILEAGGVDLVLAGHSHSYERSFLIDGHYGLSSTFSDANKKDGGDGRETGTGAYTKPTFGPGPREGAVYAVAGSSGQISGGALDHPAMFISLDRLGSMVLDVNNERLDAKFLDNTGVTRDSFTVLKGTTPTDPVRVALSRDAGRNLVATINIRNTLSSPVPNVAVTFVRASTLDGTAFVDGVPVPQSLGTVNPGQARTVTVTFPGTSTVPAGFSGLVRVDLSYTGGTFSDTQRVVTP